MNESTTRTNLFIMAERELAAFLCAVTESYGPQQAALSAEDWLAELECLDAQFGLTELDWRRVTVAAAARLAHRLTFANTRVSATPSSNGFTLELLA